MQMTFWFWKSSDKPLKGILLILKVILSSTKLKYNVSKLNSITRIVKGKKTRKNTYQYRFYSTMYLCGIDGEEKPKKSRKKVRICRNIKSPNAHTW